MFYEDCDTRKANAETMLGLIDAVKGASLKALSHRTERLYK